MTLQARHTAGSHCAERSSFAQGVRRCTALLLLTLQLAGCFRYVPVTTDRPMAGADVYVALTDRGRVELAEELGPGVQRVHGSLSNATDTEIVLALKSIEFQDLEVRARMDGEQVAIPRDLVAEFQERQLSKSRTWLTIGLVALGIAAASLVTIAGFGDDPPGDRPGGGGGGEPQ